MGDNDSEERAIRSDDVPRWRLWRMLSSAGAAGLVVVLLVGFLLRDWIPGPWRSEDAPDNPFPPGALADYIPADSEGLLVVDLRAARETPAGRRLLLPVLTLLLREKEDHFDWIDCLGRDPLRDLDSLQVSFAPGSGAQPLWLARGHFDCSCFQMGPGQLQKKTVDPFRLWEYVDRPTRRVTTLAPVGDALVVSDSPAGVLAALNQARDPRPMQVRDAILRELLAQVNRRQSVWLAASLQKVGTAARIKNFLLESILNPLLTHAESVHGGLTCAEDVRAEFHFRTVTAENAAKLETELNNICLVAQGAPVLWSREKERLPLFRLLAAGQTSRTGNIVSLHCHLTEDQLGE